MPLLQIITASTRDGRKGPLVAAWFEEQARVHGGFELEPIDLREIDLPLMNEPEHPRLRNYHHEHTKRWSARIDRADAFIFVMPEYNHMPTPSLINAVDYLHHEWAYKPVGFVSYGGVSAGSRAASAMKMLVTSLKMMPMFEAVWLPFFAQSINATTGRFEPPDAQNSAAAAMLDELLRWTRALGTLRAPRDGEPKT